MWENKDIKLVTRERRNDFVSEPDYHTSKISTENLLAMKMKKRKNLWLKLYIYDFQY